MVNYEKTIRTHINNVIARNTGNDMQDIWKACKSYSDISLHRWYINTIAANPSQTSRYWRTIRAIVRAELKRRNIAESYELQERA